MIFQLFRETKSRLISFRKSILIFVRGKDLELEKVFHSVITTQYLLSIDPLISEFRINVVNNRCFTANDCDIFYHTLPDHKSILIAIKGYSSQGLHLMKNSDIKELEELSLSREEILTVESLSEFIKFIGGIYYDTEIIEEALKHKYFYPIAKLDEFAIEERSAILHKIFIRLPSGGFSTRYKYSKLDKLIQEANFKNRARITSKKFNI